MPSAFKSYSLASSPKDERIAYFLEQGRQVRFDPDQMDLAEWRRATEHRLKEADHASFANGLRRIRGSQVNIPAMIGTGGAKTAPASPVLSSATLAEDFIRFPSESLHSFSFAAHEPNTLLQNHRQSLLRKSIDYMRDRLQAPSVTSAQARAEAKLAPNTEEAQLVGLLESAHLIPRSARNDSNDTVKMDVGSAPIERNTLDDYMRAKGVPTQEVSAIEDGAEKQDDDDDDDDEIDEESDDEAIWIGGRKKGSRSTTGSSHKTGSTTITVPHIHTPAIDVEGPGPEDRANLKRTYTDTGPLTLQTKLLDVISKPYHLADPPTSAPAHSGYSPILHSAPTKYVNSQQAIVTTGISAPWKILSANDVALRVFGLTHEEVRKTSLIDVVSEERQSWLEEKLISSIISASRAGSRANSLAIPTAHGPSRRTSLEDLQVAASLLEDESGDNTGHVILCGNVLPIKRKDGTTASASCWCKEKKGKYLVWVFEKIQERVSEIEVNIAGKIASATGEVQKSFGEVSEGEDLALYVPSIPQAEDGNIHFSQVARDFTFSGRTKAGMAFPCAIQVRREQSDAVEQIERKITLKVHTLPDIAGMIILYADSMTIASSNPVFANALFGVPNPTNTHISEFLPEFDELLTWFRDIEDADFEEGAVFPEMSFRRAKLVSNGSKSNATITPNELQAKLLLEPHGLLAKHRDGGAYEVDVQMRVVINEHDMDRKKMYALWVTYGREMNEAHFNRSKREQVIDESVNVEKFEEVDPLAEPGSSIISPQDTSAEQSEVEELADKPKKLEDFTIVEELGKGAYGEVKLARYKRKPSRKAVLKYVHKDKILVDNWARHRGHGTIPLEIHVLDFVNKQPHTNIVKMQSFFEDEANFYIEMEPCTGMDLFDYIELNLNMGEDECRSIYVQVSRALKHLHDLGIVHRDIKDENIVVDPPRKLKGGKPFTVSDIKVKLIDFGSATYIRNGPFDTFVGTIDYCSPEMLRGENYKGPPQDVWAAGILLYTMVYKENPFYNIDEIMDRDLRIPFVMSEASLDLVQRMLNRTISERPTMTEVLEHEWFNGVIEE
ncbi:serine/threonine protein kinase [Saitoella coloradoensis]